MTRTWNTTTLALAMIGALCASQALAQQTDRQQTTDKDRQQQSGNQQQVEIPAALQELNLTSEQQEQIKQAMRAQNEQIQQAWQAFNKAHLEAIALEASWVSAVRDTLSEEDKQKFDQQRMQDREMKQRAGDDADRQNRFKRPQDRQRDQAENRAGTQDADRDRADKESAENRDRETAAQRRRARAEGRETANRSARASRGQQDEGFVVITLISPEKHTEGTDQSAEQKQRCTQVCQDYKQELRTAWSKMHRLHDELVRLEADRFQAIERQLTEEQLTQLKENRQQPSNSTASTDATTGQNR